MSLDSGEMLYGVPAIAMHLGMTAKTVYHLHTRKRIPTFKLGRMVCATRSDLARHFAELRAQRAGQ